MTNFWKNKKVLVTGGTGFIGSFVCEQLLQLGATVSATTSSLQLDNVSQIQKEINILHVNLLEEKSATKATKNQDIVIHLAAKVAGIQFNMSHPSTMFGDNILLAKNILDASIKNSIERVLLTSSACVYPRSSTIPTPEDEGFMDDPEPTNLGYGWSKRTIELMGRFYNSEFGLKVAIARPYNAYGPRDNFNPETSHVIPSIIKRVFANESPLAIWGTGNQTRSFIYAGDVATGLISTTEKYAATDPVNIGSSEEISIGDLAKLIVDLSGKKVTIKFDTSKPDGQHRRSCDITKAKEKISFVASTKLKDGLKKTIEWYEQRL